MNDEAHTPVPTTDCRAAFRLRSLLNGSTNEDPNDYAKNWLHFLFVGLGASLDLVPTPTRIHAPR